MILAKILNEDDIHKLDHINALISVFFNYLFEAVKDPSHLFQDVPVEHLLVSLKGKKSHLINDRMKMLLVRNHFFEN
jgi:hypothetical protein